MHSKYLFGAEDVRSRVNKQLGLPLTIKASIKASNGAINVLVEADRSRLMPHRKGNLHWMMQPDQRFCEYAWMCITRMVKPWYEWMFIFSKPGFEHLEVLEKQYLEHVRTFIGDDSIYMEAQSVSTWVISEIVADIYSYGNVH